MVNSPYLWEEARKAARFYHKEGALTAPFLKLNSFFLNYPLFRSCPGGGSADQGKSNISPQVKPILTY